MDNKIKQVCFWIIFLSVVVLFGLFLYKENSSLSELNLANIVIILRENKIKSAESQKENTKPADTKPAEKETQIVNSGTKQTNEIADPAGQLVHHLFNIDAVPSPKAAVFTPDGKEIWVTSLLNQKRGIFVFNSQNGGYITGINLEDGGGVEIIFSSDGKKAYVSQMETAQVFEIDIASKKVLRIFDTKSAWTKILEFSFDEKKIFAANWSGDDVSEIDLETGKTVRRIPTVDTPRGLYATKDGKYLYVAGFGTGEIEKINLDTGKGKIIFKSNGAMRHFAADETSNVLYVSDMGKNIIWKVNLNNDEVIKFADTDFNPNTIDLSPDKKILFVSCRGKNFSADNYYVPGPEWGSVLIFDTETGKMLDAIVGGNQPTALAVSSDGKYLVFSDFLDARLEMYQIPPYEKLENGNGGRSNVYKSELKK